MAIFLSEALKRAIDNEVEEAALVAAFSCWKTEWSKHEFASEHFGKDGACTHPTVGGSKYKLRHVHLKPVEELSTLARWLTIFRRRGRKTGDRVLVYAHNSKGSYLLIFVLPEPDAHEVARMKTVENRKLMESFAASAQRFTDG